MSNRFVSAVALYGPKAEPLRSRLALAQALITDELGGSFRPYALEQIHATLIAFNGIQDPATGTIVNEYYLEHAGLAREMDLQRAMRILAHRFSRELAIRIGGYHPGQAVSLRSRGQHPFERTFSSQGNAFVLIGWPADGGMVLDRLRRDLNDANLLHRYHRRPADVDDDFYLVVGHHAGAPDGAVERAVGAVRHALSADPIDIRIGIGDVKVVAADTHTLAPPLFASGIPVDEAAVRALL